MLSPITVLKADAGIVVLNTVGPASLNPKLTGLQLFIFTLELCLIRYK